jgi:transcriptional regulator NrdR family protein
MKCPKCSGRTEVLETTQKQGRTRRRRECLDCSTRFTTREVMADEVHRNAEDSIPEWIRKAARRKQRLDEEAIVAAVRVDRRRAVIREQQLELARKERDALLEAGFDEEAGRLTEEMARRELEGY